MRENRCATGHTDLRSWLPSGSTGGLVSDSERVSHPAGSADLLRDTEHRRLQSLVEGDLEVAAALHADDYQLITPGGASLSREDYLGGVASGDLNYRVFEAASEISVRVFNDVGVIRYQARIEIVFSGQLDTGLFWHTDMYERREGSWQAVWSQATRIST